MRPLFFLAATILALASAFAAPASWGPGGCTVVQAAAPFSGWTNRSDEPHVHGYFVNGVQVAGYNSQTRVFRRYDAARNLWSKPERPPWQEPEPCKSNCQCEQCEDGCECPKGQACGAGNCGCLVSAKKTAKADAKCACACGCGADCPCAVSGPCSPDCSCPRGANPSAVRQLAKASRACPWSVEEAGGVTRNFGVDLSRLGGGERASINGKPVTKQELFEALGDPENGTIPDDANLLRLTVVAADKSELDRVKASLQPALGDLSGKLVVQWYTKDNWAIRPEYGFRFDALPAALLQAPEKAGQRGGKALLQAQIGADPAPLVAAVRSKVDSFDPKKVPDLATPDMSGLPWPVYAALLGAVVLVVLLFKK